jgi:hypothetical protein
MGFRKKDILLKRNREQKKKNNNKKDTKGKNCILKTYGYRGYRYGPRKAVQQYLNNKFGIKVHVDKIKPLLCSHNNKIKISDAIPFDEKLDGNKIIGNITEDKLDYMVHHVVEDSQIPLDECRKHDKTRWNTNKEKTKLKQRDRDLKNNNIIYDEY